MKKICDLHTHSVFSDGTSTPRELIAQAEKIGLSAIALTDHNTVAGLPEFLQAAQGRPLEAVPGIEFSTDYQGMDLHIVGLFVRPAVFAKVDALMEEGVRSKERSNIALVENLARAGCPLDYAAIRAATPNGQVNRAHIAAAMTEKGYTSSIRDAFSRYLDPKFGLYHPPVRPDVFSVIEFIKSLEAVAVMAHPFLKLDEVQLRQFLRQACSHGLDAMETLYGTFDEETTRRAIAVASEFHLLQSGGSDFHGRNKPDLSLGTGRGNLAVPLQFLQELRRAAEY